MDLLRIAGDVARGILTTRATGRPQHPDSGTPDSGEPWATNEAAFEVHFGSSYDYFTGVLQHLDDEQSIRFAETMEVNPEAAVLWILAMEPS